MCKLPFRRKTINYCYLKDFPLLYTTNQERAQISLKSDPTNYLVSTYTQILVYDSPQTQYFVPSSIFYFSSRKLCMFNYLFLEYPYKNIYQYIVGLLPVLYILTNYLLLFLLLFGSYLGTIC